MCLFYISLCYPWTCLFYKQFVLALDMSVLQHPIPEYVWSTAACAVSGVVWTTATCAASKCVCLQMPVLHLYMSVYKSFCAASIRVCLQDPLLHLDMCVFESFYAATRCIVYKSLCCTWIWMVYKGFFHFFSSVSKQ
jgi:hypothetical protein